MAVPLRRSLARLFRRPTAQPHAPRPPAAAARVATCCGPGAALDALEPRRLLASAVVFSDGFEGSSAPLSGWSVRNYAGSSSAPKWGPSTVKTFSGGRSAFAAGSAGPTRDAYATNQHTGLRRERLSLAGFGSASLSFKYYLNTEAAYDTFSVAVTEGGSTKTLFRDSGDDRAAGWQSRTVDLGAYAGKSNLAVEFRFDSDGTVVRDAPSGAWVDDVKLTADTRPSTGTIKGALFEDADGDRFRDSGEKALSGWTVYLDRNQNRRRDSNETWRTTDSSGRYAFSGLRPGTHYVAAEPRAGYAQTAPTAADVRLDGDFDITLHYDGSSMTSSRRAAFSEAARRWERVVVGDLPDVKDDGDLIDDLWIDAVAADIDGPGGVLAQASPSASRETAATGTAAAVGRIGLPFRASVEVDRADLSALERAGALVDVLTHEMAHALGFGTLWEAAGLGRGFGSGDPRFIGPIAVAQYNALFDTGATSVPVETEGGPGTRDSHWRESVFGTELLTGFVDDGRNPISRVTAGSLADLGYVVDLAAAEDYVPPGGHPVTLSAGAARPVTVSPGQTLGGVDFGQRRVNRPPVVGALSDGPDPASGGATVTLKATGVADPDGAVAKVNFYRETNGVAGLQSGAGGDALVGTDSSASDGFSTSFSTAGLAQGTYTYYAAAVDKSGASSAGGTAARSTRNTVQTPSRITGTVYRDVDGDGARESGEGPASGATLYLDANGNDRLDSSERKAVSDAAGNYAFNDLPAGAYTVRILPPSGFVRTAPSAGEYAVELTAGQRVTVRSFGVTAAAAITGRVYADADADGSHDSGEAGLGAWRVFIDADDDNVLDSNEQWAATGSNGTYTLGNLRPGRHTVRVVRQSGYHVTAPQTGSYRSTVAAGQKLSGRNFGVARD